MAEKESWLSLLVASGPFWRRKELQQLFLVCTSVSQLKSDFKPSSVFPFYLQWKSKHPSWPHIVCPPPTPDPAPENLPLSSISPSVFPAVPLPVTCSSFLFLKHSKCRLSQELCKLAVLSACDALPPGIQEFHSLSPSRSLLRSYPTGNDFPNCAAITMLPVNSTTHYSPCATSFSSDCHLALWSQMDYHGFCEKWYKNKPDAFSHCLHCGMPAECWSHCVGVCSCMKSSTDMPFGNWASLRALACVFVNFLFQGAN